MRSQSRLIPTENFWLSVSVGVLIPSLAVLAAEEFLDELLWFFLIASLFISGCASSIVFGTGSPGGEGYCILIAIVATVSFFAVLLVGGIRLGIWLRLGGPQSVFTTIYLILLFFPFSILVSILLSVAGSIFGWQVAQALGR